MLQGVWGTSVVPHWFLPARAALLPKAAPVRVRAVTGYVLRREQRLGTLHGVPDDLAATPGRQGLAPLAVSLAPPGSAAMLPPVDRDPWDRLLVARARPEGLSLVSADPLFAAYGVEVVW